MIRAGVVLLAIATLTIPASAQQGCAIELPETDMNNIIIINPGAGGGGSDPALAGRVTAVEQLVGAQKVPAYIVGSPLTFPAGPANFTLFGNTITLPPASDLYERAMALQMALYDRGFNTMQATPAPGDAIALSKTDGPIFINDGAEIGLPNGEVPFVWPTGLFGEIDYLQSQVLYLSNQISALEQHFEIDFPARSSEMSGSGTYDLTVDADLSTFAGGVLQFESFGDVAAYTVTPDVSGQVADLLVSLNGNGFTAVATPFGIDVSRADGQPFNFIATDGAEAIAGIENNTFVDNGIPAGPRWLSLRETIQHLLDRP